jgi:hypothetical protein
MLRWIDRNQFLSRLIERSSRLLARQRGLPVVVGIVLVGAGFAVQVINVYVGEPLFELAGVIFQNVGILIALISLLLAEPLGR